MKYSSVLAAFCLTGALATPIEKRAEVTDVTVVTRTVYVTAGDAAPTPKPAPVADKPVQGAQPKVKHTHGYKPKPKPKPEPKPEPQPGLTDYQKTVLRHHNIHRANHSADPLEWSDKLAASAAELSKSCKLQHNTDIGGGGYGQNIGFGNDIASVLTNSMYNNEVGLYTNLYGVESPADLVGDSGFGQWGHFTQMVWKKTKTVGCHTNQCTGNKFTVCNYQPPGNWAGEYSENVAKPLGHTLEVV